ncbi:DUF2384 domain-containing protein [Vibrio mimicus]
MYIVLNESHLNDYLAKNPALKDELDDVFTDFNLAFLWLTCPLPVLLGKTPLDVISEGDLEKVLRVLKCLKRGDFS